MPSVLRNSKPMNGVTSIPIAGKPATVEVEMGSELDGFLYYNATRDGRPRLSLRVGDKPGSDTSAQFIISNRGDATYELLPEGELQS